MLEYKLEEKAFELETTACMAHHAQNTYEAELSLHENFAKTRIMKEEKDNFIPAPTAYAYTSHMYRVGMKGI